MNIQSSIDSIHNKHIQEISELKNKLSNLGKTCQLKLLEADQLSHDKLQSIMDEHEIELQNELNLQKKLLTDSYELRIQHIINNSERSMRKLKCEIEADLTARYTDELNHLKVQHDTNSQSIQQNDDIKFNELFKLYNKQQNMIEDLKKELVETKYFFEARESKCVAYSDSLKCELKQYEDKYAELASKYDHIASLYQELKEEKLLFKIQSIRNPSSVKAESSQYISSGYVLNFIAFVFGMK